MPAAAGRVSTPGRASQDLYLQAFLARRAPTLQKSSCRRLTTSCLTMMLKCEITPKSLDLGQGILSSTVCYGANLRCRLPCWSPACSPSTDCVTGDIACCDSDAGVKLISTHLSRRRRFYLEILGRRRFKIQRAFEQDGYRVAVPQWFKDAPPAEGSPEAAELPALAKEVLELTAKITDSLRYDRD